MHFSVHRLFLGLALIFYLGFCLTLIPVAADDIRMVDVFSMDEAVAVAVVRFLFHTGTWIVEVFSYGGLYYHLPLIVLHGADIAGVDINDTAIVVIYRGLGTLAGVGCIWLTFKIGAFIAGATVGTVVAWLLVLTPVFLRWSVEIHPDIPQLFWLLAAVYTCCLLVQERTNARLILVGLFSGLAFGTKYAGVFSLPIIGLALFFSFGQQWVVLKERKLWLNYGLVLGVFALVAAVTNFSAFWHPQTFVNDIEFERAHLGFGHVFLAEKAGIRWFLNVWQILGFVQGVLGLGAIGWLVWHKKLTRVHFVLLAWVGLFLGYLVVAANIQAPRHLLPILPVLLIFVGYGSVTLWQEVRERWETPVYAVGAVVVLASSFLWFRADLIESLFVGKWARAENSDEIVAGRWLNTAYDEETTILYHAYAYVPEKFGQAFRVSGMDYLMVNHFEPDVLVVRVPAMKRFGNLSDADRAQIGRDAFLNRYYFYAYLKAGLIDTYALQKDFGLVAVYRRVGAKDGRRVDLAWQDRMRYWADQQVLAAAPAFEYMAKLHQEQGQGDEAQRLYRMAQDAHGTLEGAIQRGLTLLKEGQVNEAKAVFAQIEMAINNEALPQQAAVHLAIGRAFLQTGHVNDSILRAQQALKLNPDYRDAQFDLALFYVASGDLENAGQVYASAIARYGRDKRALGLLQQFVKTGLAADGAQEMLVKYFGHEAMQ